jgi:hypothetical protein
MTESSSWVHPLPAEETIFNAPFIWIKCKEQKEIILCSNLPGIVACAVIPQMGEWTLRIKIQLHNLRMNMKLVS